MSRGSLAEGLLLTSNLTRAARRRELRRFLYISKTYSAIRSFTTTTYRLPDTNEWSGEVSDLRGLRIPADAPLGTYKVCIGLYDSVGQVPLVAGPGVATNGYLRYQVGTLTLNTVEALPVNPTQATVSPGGEFTLQYRWLASSNLDARKNVFVHFLDASQNVVFQDDHLPSIPTDQWSPDLNESLPKKYLRRITASSTLVEGAYTIFVGIYGPDRIALSYETGLGSSGYLSYAVGSLSVRRITVKQVDPVQAAVDAGGTFERTYTWYASKPSNGRLVAFVHLVDPSGVIAFQDDHEPPTPTTSWPGNVSYKRTIRVPAGQEGLYRIKAGLYEPSSGARQELATGSDVTQDSDLRYEIGKLLVSLPETYAEVRQVSDYCTEDHYDDACLRQVLTSRQDGDRLRFILPVGTFQLNNTIAGTYTNTVVSGQGSATVLIRDGRAFECSGCEKFTLRDISFRTKTQP